MRPLMLMLLCLVPGLVHAEYLGDLSANPYNPNSAANPYVGTTTTGKETRLDSPFFWAPFVYLGPP